MRALICGVLALAVSRSVSAADIPADPETYRDLLATLEPGDTLHLAAGDYPRLRLEGLHGAADGWITITGPATGAPAVIVSDACCNTVELSDASYVAIEHLTVDVQGLSVDAIKAQGSPSHHIRIERNVLTGFPAEQQIVGINTKVMVWNWTVRANTIDQPGTGIYFGGSEGDTPFIAGMIENNLVLNPVGYCMQVKHQNAYAAPAGLAPGPHATVIRRNVFIKDDRESGDGDRPNLLVGGFPESGSGSEDIYEIYGNLLYYNPRESLFQGSGRVSVHDNVFLAAGSGQSALVLTPHQGKDVRLAHIYNNTIFGGATGISVAGSADQGRRIVGNVALAATPIAGDPSGVADNITGSVDEAGNYFASSSMELGMADVYPRVGALRGRPLDLSPFEDELDYDRDYNGAGKRTFEFRGAYAGEGENPGCPLTAELPACEAEPEGTSGGEGSTGATDTTDATDSATGTGGGDGSTASASDTTATGGASNPGQRSEPSSGCGCRHSGRPASWLLWPLWLLSRRRRADADAARAA